MTSSGNGGNEQFVNIPHITDELWVSIFNYLDLKQRFICRQVSKSWHRLALFGVKKVAFVCEGYEEGQKEFIDRRSVLRVKNFNEVAIISKSLNEVENVAFIGFVTPEFATQEKCEEYPMIKDQLKAISDSFDNIKRLKLMKCGFNCEMVQILMRKHKNIEKLTIHKCYVEEELDHFICDQFHNIHSFVFTWIQEFTDFEGRFEKLCKQKLRRFHYGSFQTEDYLMSSLQKTGEETLEILALPPIFWIKSMKTLSRFSQLKDLRLFFHMIEEDWWPYISFKNLEVLQLGGYETPLNDDALITIIRCSPKLKVLDLQLEMECNETEWEITDTSIESLVTNCPDLCVLCLSCAPKITEISMRNLAKLEKLEQLQISNVETITDNDLVSFVNESKSLRVLGVETKVAFNESLNAIKTKAASMPNEKFYVRFNCLNGNGSDLPVNLTAAFNNNSKEDNLWSIYFSMNRINFNTNYFRWKRL